MDELSKLRRWANRDDGRFYRIGNERIGTSSVIGVLLLSGALLLWQLRAQSGISGIWAIATGLVGLVLLLLGITHTKGGNGT